MNNYISLTEDQQRLLLSQTAALVGLPEQAVEKDLWVTMILQLVFTLPYAGKMVFKGGTTLAKAGLIERFSYHKKRLSKVAPKSMLIISCLTFLLVKTALDNISLLPQTLQPHS